MVVALSTLRISAEMDASSYVAGMAAKVSADAAGTASSTSLGAALAKQDVALDNTGGALGRMSKTFIDGYGTGVKFYGAVANLQRLVEATPDGAERAAAAYAGMVRQFRMTADASEIARSGNAQLAAVVSQVNSTIGNSVVVLGQAGKAQHAHSAAVGLGATQMMAAMHSARGMVEGLLLGISPLQIAAQQFSHLSYVLSGPGGFAAASAAARAGLTSVVGFLGPSGVIVAGFIAAAGAADYFFHLLSSSSRDVDADLKRHKELIDQVRAAYGEAGKAATSYADKAGEAFKLKIGTAENLTNIKTDLQAALQAVRVTILETTHLGAGLEGTARNAFGALTPQAIAFADAIKAGTPNIEAFESALRGVALDPTVNDGLHRKALRMLEMMDAVDRLTVSLKNAQGASQVVAGGSPLPDPGAASRAAKASITGQMLALHSVGEFGNRFDPTAANAAAAKQATADAQRQRDAISGVTESLKFQMDQLGRTAREQAIYEAEQRGGIDTTKSWNDAIAASAGKLYDQQEAMKKSIAALDDMRSTAHDVLGTIVSDMQQGKRAGDIYVDVLGKIETKLMDMATNTAIDSLFGKAGTSGLGLLGKILGFGGGSGVSFPTPSSFSARGNVFEYGRVMPYAIGGVVNRPTMFPMAGGMGLAGEAGAEGILPLGRGSDGRMGVIAHGGGGTVVNVDAHTTITFAGSADKDTVAALRAELDRRDRRILEVVPHVVAKANRNRIGR